MRDGYCGILFSVSQRLRISLSIVRDTHWLFSHPASGFVMNFYSGFPEFHINDAVSLERQIDQKML